MLNLKRAATSNATSSGNLCAVNYLPHKYERAPLTFDTRFCFFLLSFFFFFFFFSLSFISDSVEFSGCLETTQMNHIVWRSVKTWKVRRIEETITVDEDDEKKQLGRNRGGDAERTKVRWQTNIEIGNNFSVRQILRKIRLKTETFYLTLSSEWVNLQFYQRTWLSNETRNKWNGWQNVSRDFVTLYVALVFAESHCTLLSGSYNSYKLSQLHATSR